MYYEIFKGILLPFLGTTLGSACVFFIKKGLRRTLKEAISGFAAGVMIAASVWSLLIPAMEYESSQRLGIFSFLPATIGLWIGVFFYFLLIRFCQKQKILGIYTKIKCFFYRYHSIIYPREWR